MNVNELIYSIRSGDVQVPKVIKGSNHNLILDDGRDTEGVPFVTEYNPTVIEELYSLNYKLEPIKNYPYRSEVIGILKKLGKPMELLDDLYRIDFLVWGYPKPDFDEWIKTKKIDPHRCYISDTLDRIG